MDPGLATHPEGGDQRGGAACTQCVRKPQPGTASSPCMQTAEGAVARQEHGILLVEARLKLALVIQVKVRVVRADSGEW